MSGEDNSFSFFFFKIGKELLKRNLIRKAKGRDLSKDNVKIM